MNAPSGAPIVVIGDVHGDAPRLERALEAFGTTDRTVVLVGDYVNRGPASRQCLDLLVTASAELGARLRLLRGNHEDALLSFLGGGPVADFAAHGGLATIHSYVDQPSPGTVALFLESFPAAHRRLLEETELFLETEDLLISHGGFDPRSPHDRSPAAMIRPRGGEIFRHTGAWPRTTTVMGHFVQRSRVPWLSEHLVCLDTGCGTLPDGPLTAVEFPSRRVHQF